MRSPPTLTPLQNLRRALMHKKLSLMSQPIPNVTIPRATPRHLTKIMPVGPDFAHTNCPSEGGGLKEAGKLQNVNIWG